MTGSPDPGQDAGEVFDFVSMFLADRAAGRAAPLAHYLERFPGLQAEVAAEYAQLVGPADTGLVPLRRIGPYRILEQLGSGGQGTVLLAEDTRLGRRVALKILAPHLDFVSSDRLARFRREAEVLSQLDHPAICAVYEADACDGVPFLAMRHVDGRTLAAILGERRAAADLPRTRAQLHEVMGWIETCARAVHEAHEQGIVHRDIKPGNLMITEQGQPVLLDFGLARQDTGVDTAITQPGDVVGTLAYMAPELLSGKPGRVDRRADVYALGVMLHECLTLQLPFAAATRTALWRAIECGDAVDPRSLNPALPRELVHVVRTAMAAAVGNRYATAADLADDLERVRTRQPIRAHRVPVSRRAMLWLQRHPTLAFGIAALLVLVVVLSVALERVSANERAAIALNAALQAKNVEADAATALKGLLAAADRSPRTDLRNAMLRVLDQCSLAWQVPREIVNSAYLNYVPPPPALDVRGRYVALGTAMGVVDLRSAATGERVVERRLGDGSIHGLTFLPNGSLCATTAGGVHFMSGTDLQPLPAWSLPSVGLGAAIAFNRRGDTVAIACDQQLCLVGLADGVRREIDLGEPATKRRVLFSADGSQVAVLGEVDCVDPHGCNRLWIVDVANQAVVRAVRATEEMLWIAWHPTENVLAVAHNAGLVEVVRAGEPLALFSQRCAQEVNWCDFDPTGELLLIPAVRDTALWRWAAAQPTVARRLVHPSERTVGAGCFDPVRQLLAMVLRDGSVVIWSTADWQPLRHFQKRVRDVRSLQWHPPSGMLLCADLDNLSAWYAGARPHAPEFWGHQDAVTSVAMHPDGRRVLTGSRDRTVRLWSLDQPGPVLVLPNDAPVRRALFAPDGARIVTLLEGSGLRVSDLRTGEFVGELRGHDGEVVDVAFVGADEMLSIGEDGRCVLWDLARTQAIRQCRPSEAPLRSLAVHPARSWVALGGSDQHVTVWDWVLGAAVRRLRGSEYEGTPSNPIHQVRGVVWLPTANVLCASLVNDFGVTWDIAADWRRHIAHIGDIFGGPMIVAIEPDGREAVVFADYSFGNLTRLRGNAHQPLLVDDHGAHSNRISALKLAPGGRHALSAGHDGQLLVWDLEQGMPVQRLRTSSAILDADFSGDGKWFVTACADGTVKLWARDPEAMARDYLQRRDGTRR